MLKRGKAQGRSPLQLSPRRPVHDDHEDRAAFCPLVLLGLRFLALLAVIDWLKQRLPPPSVAPWLRHLAPPLNFLRARLARNSDVGLRLTMSALLFIGATWLFAGVAEDVVTEDPLVAVDQVITQWFQRHSAAGVSRCMLLVTNAHDVRPIAAVGLAFAIFLAWRRYWYWLLTLVLVLPGGMVFNLLLKQVFQRGRPILDEPLLGLASYSFPSGHVTAATLLYGVLAAFLATRTPHMGTRVALYTTACFMVILVATTRVYLGAHYFSDVVAAAAWSTAWVVLCVVLVAAQRRRRADTRGS